MLYVLHAANPPNVPGLCPIEHLWGKHKQAVYKEDQTLQQLKRRRIRKSVCDVDWSIVETMDTVKSSLRKMADQSPRKFL